MPRVKWGIGTRYCRSFQRRHSICPIRVSCITGSNQGWIGSNGIELNSIESFSTEECPRCGAIFHLDPFGSVLSSFPYSITGVGGGEEVGRLRAANADQAFDHVQEISGPRIPRKISASSKLPCRPPTLSMSKVFGTDYCSFRAIILRIYIYIG